MWTEEVKLRIQLHNLRAAFSGKCIAFKTRLNRNVVHEVLTTAALDADLGGFGFDGRGSDHDTLDFNHAGYLFGLKKQDKFCFSYEINYSMPY